MSGLGDLGGGGGEADSDGGEEQLDPRVQQELEKLNACTEEINLLETQLEDANCLFRYIGTTVYRVTHLVGKTLLLTCIWDVLPSCLCCS